MVQLKSNCTEQSESSPFFVPKLTTPGLIIRIGLSVIEDLGFATIEGLKSVPKRGLEIGGILLGRFDAAQSTILIEDHEPVESEHLHGPSWLLSPKDRSVLRQALDRLRAGSPQQPQPIGFYRSQTRDGLSFDEQDNAIVREMFSREIFNGEPALCLLVKPSLAEPSVAQIGMMTEGVLQPVAVFPFHEGVLREGDFPIVDSAPPPQPVSTPLPVMPALSDADPEPEPRGRIPLTATLIAIAAAILLGIFLIARSRTPHVPPAVQPVAATIVPQNQLPAANNAVLLNVKRENGTATLSWNRNASAVKNADYALLLISDGRHQEQLRLSKTDLETGRVVYIPRDGDISFRLQLFAQSQSTTESVRSVADLPAATADSHLPRRPRRNLEPAATVPPVYHAPEITPPPLPTISEPPTPSGAQPPVTRAAPPQEATVAPEAPKPTPFSPEPDKTPPKPREPEVVTTVSLELIGHSGVKEVLGHIFSGGDKTTPPRVIRQILPGIYPALAARIHGTRQVDVKITIGPGGQVVKTELVDERAADPVDSVVYYAARPRTFAPARIGSRPVESKVLMHFVLKRSS